MTTCLAFDPGPTSTQAAVVHMAKRKPGAADTFTVTLLEKFDSKPAAITEIIKTPADIVAVETTSDYIHAAAKLQLVQTATIVGRLLQAAHDREIFTLPANSPGKKHSWRYYLTGNPRAGDADVSVALNRRNVDMPTRTNAHQRDAIGLAVVALILRSAK